MSREWVSEIVDPRPAAASAARPDSRTVGGSPGDDLDLAQAEAARSPSALTTASLAAKRAARWRPGRARAAAYSTLGRGEDPLGEPGMALQGALHPLDLEQVDADAGHQAARYLPRPTISFAVARSPEAPEPIAR